MKNLTRVLVVGSNPTKKNDDPSVPFWGTKSGDTLRSWLDIMDIDMTRVRCVNVSSKVTEGNRKLKVSEYELDVLERASSGVDKVIALGETASDALRKIGVDHFKLPHPSGLNRKLNDKTYMRSQLTRCYAYLWRTTAVVGR